MSVLHCLISDRSDRVSTEPVLCQYCSGAQIKTRKRNIAVPLDPASFADAVVEIFQDSKEGDDLEKNLQAAVKASVHTQA